MRGSPSLVTEAFYSTIPMPKTSYVALGLAAALSLAIWESARLVRFTFAEPHMGTTCRITLYGVDERSAGEAAKAAFARIAQLDDMMTDYRPSSELMRLCEKAGTGPVPVSGDLFTVLAYGQEISKLSDGAFDVSVGPLVQLWRRARRTKLFPDPVQIAGARDRVGYRYITLDGVKHTVRLEKPGMRLDLGGIAKGYAADEALKVLGRHGVSRALVAAGGDIAASEGPPDARGWKVGIAPLHDPSSQPTLFVCLANAAVSTSGDAEQHVVIDGVRYSHIIDPRTGLPLTARRSVSVVAAHGIAADSLTKVVSILGQRGLGIIEDIPGTAAYVVQETDQKQQTFASKHFQDWVLGADK
jgi:thiamine biosynthesis lipoprotein